MARTRDPIQVAGEKFVDISSNKYREYAYATPFGTVQTVRIDGPEWLHVKPQNLSLHSHRLIDKRGRSHYMPSGFLNLVWESDERFVMIDPKDMTTNGETLSPTEQ